MIGANSLSKSQPEATKKNTDTGFNGGSSDTSDTEGFVGLMSEDAMDVESTASSFPEIPFLALLPSIDSEEAVLIESSPVKPAVADVDTASSLRQSIKKRIPRHMVHYVTQGPFPKYIKLGLTGLLMTFAAHMICIAIGMYQISRIDPRTITVQRLHLRGLEGREAVLEAEAFIPMPWMARFFHINVVGPRVVVEAEGRTLVTADIPDVIVGRRGAKVKMNGVRFQMGSAPSSPLSIILQQFLPTGMIKGRPVNKLKVLMTGRLQTKSFWYPLDIRVNTDHEIDIPALKALLAKQKQSDEEPPQLPEITSVRISDLDSDSIETKVRATIKLPPRALSYFMTLDVPELVGRLSLVAPGKPEREAEHLYIGTVLHMHGRYPLSCV